MKKQSAAGMSHWEYLRAKRPRKTLEEFCAKYNYTISWDRQSTSCLLFGLDSRGNTYQYRKAGELISYFIEPGGLILFEWDATEIVSPRSLRLMPFVAGSREILVNRNITLHGIDDGDNLLAHKIVHSKWGIIQNLNQFSCIYTVVDKNLLQDIKKDLNKLGMHFALIQVGKQPQL